MRKVLCALLSAGLAAACLTGCVNEAVATAGTVRKPVSLTVWGAEEDRELLSEITESFKTEYSSLADFNITIKAQSESSCKDALLDDPLAGADVFAFADDQLGALAAAGVLMPIENADHIRAENLSSAVKAASVNNVLYAYPLTSDNGYFLYYNKAYLSADDVQRLDTILNIADQSGRYFTMDWSSAWYVYSFFGGTGMTVGLNEDGVTNYCTWNRTDGDIKGIDVLEAMTRISGHQSFLSSGDSGFIEGAENGSVIAGISGAWNSEKLSELWGDNLGAAKLPTYTCAGKQVQMASFSGSKLIGVNAYSKEHEWAEKLAEWISNEKNQTLRFEMRGQISSNVNAAKSDSVMSSPIAAAVMEQAEYSQLQRVGERFWDPPAEMAMCIYADNPPGADFQRMLDVMVNKMTAK
ncbi:MAG: extracellular solute-binding protein [Oscillospiraceae bacterium]|nr:extracellular solute-binding protein [Oscillospiraceae bacterium]